MGKAMEAFLDNLCDSHEKRCDRSPVNEGDSLTIEAQLQRLLNIAGTEDGDTGADKNAAENPRSLAQKLLQTEKLFGDDLKHPQTDENVNPHEMAGMMDSLACFETLLSNLSSVNCDDSTKAEENLNPDDIAGLMDSMKKEFGVSLDADLGDLPGFEALLSSLCSAGCDDPKKGEETVAKAFIEFFLHSLSGGGVEEEK